MNQFALTTSLAVITSVLALSQMEFNIAALLLISGVSGWAITARLIPNVSDFMRKKRIFGLDINKKGSKEGEKEIP